MGGRANREDRKEIKPNIFRYAALVQWANVEMYQERFAEAAKLYQKALAEGGNDPNVNVIYVKVNLGRCLIKSGDLEGGYDLISPALANQRASEGLKQVIFMILAQDWSPQVDLPAMRDFVDQYRQIVSLDLPEDRFERNPRFMELAQTAFQEDDPIRALGWYSLMIDPLEMVPPLQAEIDELVARKVDPALEAKKAEFLANMRKDKYRIVNQSWQLINGAGSVHFQMKNFGAAYVMFSKLSDEVPETHPQRPVYLHNSVASAARIGKWTEAHKYGSIFMENFPEHELMPGVARHCLRGDLLAR